MHYMRQTLEQEFLTRLPVQTILPPVQNNSKLCDMIHSHSFLLNFFILRLTQSRVLGTPVLQAQRLSRPTFIARPGASANPALVGGSASLMGPGLVRGAGPSMMQQLVRQRYLGGPVMPGRGIQIVAGRPVR